MERAPTGVTGLDDVLGGGFPRGRIYLVQGTPGVGKTTLALEFLRAGARAGENVLYITLSETREEIVQIAASHGWDLEGISLFELTSAEQHLRLSEENTLYATADIELRETMRVLLAEVERVSPDRVVFDSLSEVRLLSQTAVRYRRQLLALKQYFARSERQATVLLLDDRTSDPGDRQLESLVHGVLHLEQMAVQYGGDRRRLRVGKIRGARFRSGHHDFVVETGGLVVFPRLIAAEHRTSFRAEPIGSGIPGLDKLLGGGVDRGTATLVIGPAGTGKSAISAQYACAAASRGEHASMFLFEERIGTLLERSRQLGMPLDGHLAAGTIDVQQIDPAELAPDQFVHHVRSAVIERGARVVVIDSLNGYYNAMPEARFLTLQMHELLSFLAERGVATLMTVAQSGVHGTSAPIDLSYLADTIVLLRYFEDAGTLRKAISVVKKRSGAHEQTIRELVLAPGAITIGDPLVGFRGVLGGSGVAGVGERA